MGVAGIGLAVSAFSHVCCPALGGILGFGVYQAEYTAKAAHLLGWLARRSAHCFGHNTLLAGVQGADNLFNIVFFVVLSSTLLQGTPYH